MHHRKETLMCTTARHDGSCPTCETDEWVVPADLREPQTTTMPPMRGDGGEER